MVNKLTLNEKIPLFQLNVPKVSNHLPLAYHQPSPKSSSICKVD